MKCGNCGYTGDPERSGEHFVTDHFVYAHNEIKRLKPFEDRNNETLDHIKEWLRPILGTEVAPMEEEDIRYIKELLEKTT